MSYLVDDLYPLIINNLDYKECLSFSMINKYFSVYCKREQLWEQLFKLQFNIPCHVYYYESFKYLYNRCLYKIQRGKYIGYYCGQKECHNKRHLHHLYNTFNVATVEIYDIDKNIYINPKNNILYKGEKNGETRFIGKVCENKNVLPLSVQDLVQCHLNIIFIPHKK